jgi:carboxyl-terminal processing protease
MRLALAVLLACAAPGWAQNRALPDPAPLAPLLKNFTSILAIATDNAADPVNLAQVLQQGALPGMLRQLDPHSVFFDRDQFEQLQAMEKSVSKGFGTVVSVLPGRVIILQTLAGTPSQKSGLQPGDEILSINQVPLARLDMEQLIGLLGATRQHTAELLVRRQGSPGLLSFTLVPEALQSASVDRLITLRPGAAYLRISSFDVKTGEQVREAIEKLGGKALGALVVDLRDNPGGVLPAALETAALFLKPGARLLSVRGRIAEDQAVDVPAEAQPFGFKLAILINSKSASGAEIVAGAVQDNDRGVILGEPSFGKGLVQSVYPLSEGAGLALTTAFYYTPSGRSIQRPLTGQLTGATAAGRPEHKTVSGRIVRGGGGIEPDHILFPKQLSRLATVLEASGSFPGFATEYIRPRRSLIDAGWQVTPMVLDEFQYFLSQRNIRPGMADWSAHREWITGRLHQEILNQAVSVAAGDEVEVRSDPLVRRALELLGVR